MSFIASIFEALASGFASTDNKFSPQDTWADVECPKELL